MIPDFTIFKVTQLSVAVATILASAYVWVNVNGTDGFFFFIFGALFTITLRVLEQTIFTDNIAHERYSSYRY